MTSPHSTNPTSNISLSSVSNSPFIFGNIALLAGTPWLLMLSMAGLAVGDPVFPAWFEIFLLGFPAIAFVTWLHWQKPFSPFSLWFVAKQNESLSDRDRQVLTLVKQHSNGWYVTGWIATAIAIVMGVIFCKMYLAAPLAQSIAPFPAELRLFGIVWAEIFFLLSNVLLQAGVSALRIKLTAESELDSMKPFAVEKIKNSFTSIGWRSPQLLKFFEEDAIVQTDLPQIAAPDQVPDIKEPQDTEELESKNLIFEVEPEEIKVEEILEPIDPNLNQELEVNDLVEEILPENIESLEIVELEPIEFVGNLEVTEILEPIVIISEPDTEQISERYQTENSLEEIAQELEDLEPIELIEASEVDTFLDIADTTLETETEESTIDQIETVSEISDISLDEQIAEEVEEVEELEINAIVAEESVIELNSEPEIEHIIEETQIETLSDTTLDADLDTTFDQEIIQESGDLDFVDISEDTDTVVAVADTTETELDKSEIAEAETILEVSNIAQDEVFVEAVEDSQANAIAVEEVEELETSKPVLDEQIMQDSDKLEFIETVDESTADNFSNKTITSAGISADTSTEKRGLDFLKKSRKSGVLSKKLGFGKSLKRDHNFVSIPETIEPVETELGKSSEQNAIANNEFDEATFVAIAIPPIEQDVETPKINTQDFDDELDELIAFNAYVENILENYLEESEAISEAMVEVDEIAAPSAILEQILVVEDFTENLPDLEIEVPEEITEEIDLDSNDQEPKDPKYLVQEFLVDKFLARLEELNVEDKAGKANEQTQENTASPHPKDDEFADLEALLDGSPSPENSDDDLSDRNS